MARSEPSTGVDLPLDQGRICGLLGPNGAGKTTAVRVLSTLARCDAGSATGGTVPAATPGRRAAPGRQPDP